jgi:hypothetical protein
LTGEDNKAIKYKVKKSTGSGLVNTNNLQLKITTEGGKRAIIKNIGDRDSGEIQLNSLNINPHTNTSRQRQLIIDHKGEEKVQFTLQLIYDGKPVGEPRVVEWSDH